MVNSGLSLRMRILLASCATVLIVLLLAAIELKRPVPNYYVERLQVTGVYTRQDIQDLTAVVRAHGGEGRVSWIRVPSALKDAFARGEMYALPADVAEVFITTDEDIPAGSMYTLRKREGGWSVEGTAIWMR